MDLRQIGGIVFIVLGAYAIIKRRIPISTNDFNFKPSFEAKGKWAVLVGILSILLGVSILWN